MSVHPTQRQLSFAFCQAHLKARPGGVTITDEAVHILLAHVKACISKIGSGARTLEDVTITALDKFPLHRIDLDILEKYDLVARNPEYATSATGDQFKYRWILAEAIVDGEPKLIIEWVPTWEPVGNVPKSHVKKFHDKKRGKRTTSRRAKVVKSRASKKK